MVYQRVQIITASRPHFLHICCAVDLHDSLFRGFASIRVNSCISLGFRSAGPFSLGTLCSPASFGISDEGGIIIGSPRADSAVSAPQSLPWFPRGRIRTAPFFLPHRSLVDVAFLSCRFGGCCSAELASVCAGGCSILMVVFWGCSRLRDVSSQDSLESLRRLVRITIT